MSSLNPPKKNQVRVQLYLDYDPDIQGRKLFFRVDLTVKEDGVTIKTPIPPLYQARLGNEKPLEVSTRKVILPRNYECCFVDPTNSKKAVTRGVYNPYRPGTQDWKELGQELFNYPDVVSVNYQGESHNQDFEDFIS